MKINGWTLHHKDGRPVAVGDVVTDFRGDKFTIVGGRPPHKSSSSGFVDVGQGHEFYVGVFGLKWSQGEKK